MARRLSVVQEQEPADEVEQEEEEILRGSPPKRPRTRTEEEGEAASRPTSGSRAVAEAAQLRMNIQDLLGRAEMNNDLDVFDSLLQHSILSDPRYDFLVQVLSGTGRAGHLDPSFVMDTTMGQEGRKSLQFILQRREKISELLEQIHRQRETLQEAEHIRLVEATAGVTSRVRRLRAEQIKIQAEAGTIRSTVQELTLILDRLDRPLPKQGEIDLPVVALQWWVAVKKEWDALSLQKRLSLEVTQSTRLLRYLTDNRETASKNWGNDAFANSPTGKWLTEQVGLGLSPASDQRKLIGVAIFEMALPFVMIEVPVLSSPTWFERAPYPSVMDNALFNYLFMGSFVTGVLNAVAAKRGARAGAQQQQQALAVNPIDTFTRFVILRILRESSLVKQLISQFRLSLDSDSDVASLFYQTGAYVEAEEETESSDAQLSAAARFLRFHSAGLPVQSEGRLVRDRQRRSPGGIYGIGYDTDIRQFAAFLRLFPWLAHLPKSLPLEQESESYVDSLIYSQCLQQGIATILAGAGSIQLMNFFWEAFEQLGLPAPVLKATRESFLKELELRFAPLFFERRYFDDWNGGGGLRLSYQAEEIMPRLLAQLLESAEALSNNVLKLPRPEDQQSLQVAEDYRMETALEEAKAAGTLVQQDLEAGLLEVPALQTNLERFSTDRVLQVGYLMRLRSNHRKFTTELETPDIQWPEWLVQSRFKDTRDQWREFGRIAIGPPPRFQAWEAEIDEASLKRFYDQLPGLDIEGAHLGELVAKLQAFLVDWRDGQRGELATLDLRTARLESQIERISEQSRADPVTEARAAADFSGLEAQLREENERLTKERASLLARANLGGLAAMRGDVYTATGQAYSFIRNHRLGAWCDALNGAGGSTADEQGIYVLMTTRHSRARNAFASLTIAFMVTAEQRSGSRAIYQQTRMNDLTEVEKLNVASTLVAIPAGEILTGGTDGQFLYHGLLMHQ
jgi:hypothetical protein